MASSFVKELTTEGKGIAKMLVGIDRRVFFKDPFALTDMLEGEKEIVYICYDNEIYVDELIKKAVPSLDLHKKQELTREEVISFIKDKNLPFQINDLSLSYSATACPSFPLDLMEKIKKALRCSGTSFINVLAPCPTGWRFKPELTVYLGLLAVETGFYPLFERENGVTKITKRVIKRKPISDYFKVQQRYVGFPPEWIKLIQEVVSEEYEKLIKGA